MNYSTTLDTFESLIEAGVDINIIEKSGKKALFISSERTGAKHSTANIDSGVNLNQKTKNQKTILSLLTSANNTSWMKTVSII